ncbi:MAG: hypothetical protein WKF75_01565 [Singulisphaera sp.]
MAGDLHHQAGTGGRTPAALTGAAAVAGYLLRTAGLALLAAWVGESLIRRRFKQAAARGAVALVPIILWQGYITDVTASPAYRRPAYPYQRADYYYSNVPYAQNSRLVDPFRPELGRATAGQLLVRTLANARSLPAAMGAAISVPEHCWKWPIAVARGRLGVTRLPEWPMRIPILLLGALVVAGASVMTLRGRWFVPLCFVASVALIVLAPWPGQFPLPDPDGAVHGGLPDRGGFLADWSCRAGRPWGGLVRGRAPPDGSCARRGRLLDDVELPPGTTCPSCTATGAGSTCTLLHYSPEWVALDDSLGVGPPARVSGRRPRHDRAAHRVRPDRRQVGAAAHGDGPGRRPATLGRGAGPVRGARLAGRPGPSPRYAEPAVRDDPARWRLVYTAGPRRRVPRLRAGATGCPWRA